MLIDWIKNISNTLNEESDKVSRLKRELLVKECFINYMPSICMDIWPVHALEEVGFKSYRNKKTGVYVIPVGEQKYALQKALEHHMNNIYLDNNSFDVPSFYLYKAQLLETVLFYDNNIERYSCLGDADKKYNVVLLKYKLKNGKISYLFYVFTKAETFWNTIEKYEIKIEMIIDSYKGLGDFFYKVPLYKIFKEKAPSEFLPKYYFKGKYISCDAPERFTHIGTIKEESFGDCDSKLYLTNFDVK